MAKGKKIEHIKVDPIKLAEEAREIGISLENPPVNLDRGSYVTGTISFGSLCLDLLTGGGIPPGKIVDIFGAEGAGKSTFIYHSIGNAMRESSKGANDSIPTFLFDHEAGADAKYLGAVGLKIRMPDGSKNPLFNYYQPTTGESTYRTINRILDKLPDYTSGEEGRPRPTALFVIDSLASMLAEDINETDDKNPMATDAKVHSQGMKLIKAKLGRKNCTLLCTNQTREKPGVMYGNPEYEPGGSAIKYYPDLKIKIRGVGKPWTERGRHMKYININTIKNKQFVPFLELKETVAIAFGHGVERGYDSLGFLQMTNQVSKKGAGYYTLHMPGTHWDQKVFRQEALMELCHKNLFRAYLRSQIESGEAFEAYFKSQNWEDMYKADLEDAGTGAFEEGETDLDSVEMAESDVFSSEETNNEEQM
jgi:recombination protein RecA